MRTHTGAFSPGRGVSFDMRDLTLGPMPEADGKFTRLRLRGARLARFASRFRSEVRCPRQPDNSTCGSRYLPV